MTDPMADNARETSPGKVRAKSPGRAAQQRKQQRNRIPKQVVIPREQMRALQGGVCAVCGSERHDDGTDLHVDHCHETGVIRGLLCRGCNIGLGCFKDSIESLRAAIAYLENPPGVEIGRQVGAGAERSATLARVRWHVRRAHQAATQGEREAALDAMRGADALLAELELDADAGRLRAA